MWGKYWLVCMRTFHIHCSSCFLYIFVLYEKWSRSQVTRRRCYTSAVSERQNVLSSTRAVHNTQDNSTSTWTAERLILNTSRPWHTRQQHINLNGRFQETEKYCISKTKQTCILNQCEQFQSRMGHKITAMHDCFYKESVTKRKSSWDKYAVVLVLLAVQY